MVCYVYFTLKTTKAHQKITVLDTICTYVIFDSKFFIILTVLKKNNSGNSGKPSSVLPEDHSPPATQLKVRSSIDHCMSLNVPIGVAGKQFGLLYELIISR